MAVGRQLWGMLIAVCLSGQAGAAHVETVRIDPDRIDAVAKIPFKCAYRLGSVVDQRPVGEEAGSLDEMLDKVATYYEDEVDTQVDSLTSLMEPIIMSVLGVLVGGLVMAMYLPIFQLGNVV